MHKLQFTKFIIIYSKYNISSSEFNEILNSFNRDFLMLFIRPLYFIILSINIHSGHTHSCTLSLEENKQLAEKRSSSGVAKTYFKEQNNRKTS